MLLEYTVPKGPSNRRPPALIGPSRLVVPSLTRSVWQPQPPVAPKTYLPRAMSAALGCASARNEQVTDSANTTTRGSRRRKGRPARRMIEVRTTEGARWFPRSRARPDLARVQVGLHDERVFTRVVVVATPSADDAEAKGVVERAGFVVGRTDLEGHGTKASIATIVEDGPKQSARKAATPQSGMDGDVRHMQLVADLPQAQVAGDAVVVAEDPAPRDAVLLDLVEKGPARPRHTERRALDRDDLVEVVRAHRTNGQRGHDA